MKAGFFAILATALAAGAGAHAADRVAVDENVASRPGMDAPELARLGGYAVGVRALTLVDHAAIDLSHVDATSGAAPRHDRTLTVDLWYPARATAGAKAERYRGALSGENG